MKKVFSLFAAICMAVAMFADVNWVSFPSLQTSYSSEGFVIDRSADTGSKNAVDENSARFGTAEGYVSFATRLKTGGKSSSSANYLTLTIPADGKVYIAVRTGSNSATDRNVVLTQGETTLLDHVVLESEAVKVTEGETEVNVYPVLSADVVAGTATITYPVNGVNFYAIGFEAAGSAPAVKTVITAEKLWSNPIANMTAVADARQGSGHNGVVYVMDKGAHTVWAYAKADNAVTKTAVATDDLLDGTAIAVDAAGNIIVEGTFPNTPSHLAVVKAGEDTVRNFEHAGLGRTDFISATGDIFSAVGGYVYLYSNSAKAQAVHFVNGAIESVSVIESIATAATGGQVVYAGTPNSYIAQVRASALQFVGREAVTLPNIYNSKLGLDVFTIAGKEVYAYNVGTAYNSYFQLYNSTDDALISDMEGATLLFGVDPTKAQSTSCANWLHASAIDENNVYVHQYCGSDGAALWKVSAVQAAEVALSANDATMGTVAGAGDKALNSSVTVTATPNPGYSFVGWTKGGQTVSTEASYTFTATENVALVAVFQAEENKTLTLAVNNAANGSITLPEGVVMGDNSVVYGTEVSLTAVPAEGKTFTGWTLADGTSYSTEYTITVKMTEALSLVANFTSIVTITYELNGGVTNDEGWVSKADVMLSIQEDYNEAYNGSLSVVKEENGEFYFYINGEWKTEAESAGTDALVAGFFQNKTWSADQKCANLFLNTKKDKYAWLVDLIDHFAPSANAARGTDSIHNMVIATADAYFRADVSGFMLCSPATGAYPYTCDWVSNGTPDAILPVWKHAFANPTEIKGEVILNAPYKEGYTFDGWYANADFSGEKVVTVNTETTATTLYAKWIEYIPTLAEVAELADNTTTKAVGVVTYVRSGNIYIQDATAGMLVYAKDLTATVGDKIKVSGTKVTYNGAPEVKNAVIESSEAASLPTAALKTLGAIKADGLNGFAKLVRVEGVLISSYDSKGNAYVTDRTDTLLCYYMTPDQTAFPVGTKVNLKAVVGYYNGVQLCGETAWIEAASAAGRDTYQYPARGENGEYTLVNNWIYSNIKDNFSDNKPNVDAQTVRGMAAKDGIMYFIERSGVLVRVNAENGMMLEPLTITGDHLFEVAGEDGSYSSAVTLKFNDIKIDNAGNALMGACVSGGQHFMIYKVDLTTGAATLFIDEKLYDNEDFGAALQAQDPAWRFDAFGVYGDVNSHAVIMAMDANSYTAYRWEVENGVASTAIRVPLSVNADDDTYLLDENKQLTTWNSGAPQCFPVDEEYFYIDGHACLPTLFQYAYDEDEGGAIANFVEDFKSCPTGIAVVNNAGDTTKMNQGHNGICEFQIGEDYFVVLAATNTVGTPTSSFAIYKYADAAKEFGGMTPLWYFPNEGMGSMTNGCRTAVPTVEVNQETGVATIYVFTADNGYGVYTMTGVAGAGDAVENVEAVNDALKVVENGQVYIIRNGVRYTVLGVRVK